MISTGVIRGLDKFGRVVLPSELRKNLNIKIDDSLGFYVEGNTIILKKYDPACVFCGEARNVSTYKEQYVCKKCMTDIKK